MLTAALAAARLAPSSCAAAAAAICAPAAIALLGLLLAAPACACSALPSAAEVALASLKQAPSLEAKGLS